MVSRRHGRCRARTDLHRSFNEIRLLAADSHRDRCSLSGLNQPMHAYAPAPVLGDPIGSSDWPSGAYGFLTEQYREALSLCVQRTLRSTRDRRQSGISRSQIVQIVPSDAIHPFGCHAKARRPDCVPLHDEPPISYRPLAYKSVICFCTFQQGCYSLNMNVAATEFRAQLRHWLDRARAGEEVVITERGVPVARLSGIDSTPLIERLTAQDVISAPQSSERPRASDQQLPHPRVPVSELVSDQRR